MAPRGGMWDALRAASKRAEEDPLTGWAPKHETRYATGGVAPFTPSKPLPGGERSDGATWREITKTVTVTIDKTGVEEPTPAMKKVLDEAMRAKVEMTEAMMLKADFEKRRADHERAKAEKEMEMAFKSRPSPYGSKGGPPHHLLDKLLIHVRVPGNSDEDGDLSWSDIEAISTYRKGWRELQDEGYVTISIEAASDITMVRFTSEGLRLALSRNVSDKAVEVRAVEERAAKAPAYAANPLYGLI